MSRCADKDAEIKRLRSELRRAREMAVTIALGCHYSVSEDPSEEWYGFQNGVETVVRALKEWASGDRSGSLGTIIARSVEAAEVARRLSDPEQVAIPYAEARKQLFKYAHPTQQEEESDEAEACSQGEEYKEGDG